MQSLSWRLRRHWSSATWVDIGWLIGCALLFWASKGAGKLLHGVPGHAGAFWIPALFLARAVGRPGAATFTALMGASLWCFPRGGGSVELAPYVVAGIVLDALDADAARLRRLPFALLAGAAGHLAKFGVHNVPAALLGMPEQFLTWGMAPVAGLHVLFGLTGGLVGWALLRTAGRAHGIGPSLRG